MVMSVVDSDMESADEAEAFAAVAVPTPPMVMHAPVPTPRFQAPAPVPAPPVPAPPVPVKLEPSPAALAKLRGEDYLRVLRLAESGNVVAQKRLAEFTIAPAYQLVLALADNQRRRTERIIAEANGAPVRKLPSRAEREARVRERNTKTDAMMAKREATLAKRKRDKELAELRGPSVADHRSGDAGDVIAFTAALDAAAWCAIG